MVLSLCVALALQSAPRPKNVILMIADGCGYNAYAAASMYDGRYGREIFNGPDWIHMPMASYPLQMDSKPTMNAEQDLKIVYDPAKAWGLDAYKWLDESVTDSAASASAYATGKKHYKRALSWSALNQPEFNVNDLFKAAGKAVGVVTSVEWSDATPAAFVAHNPNRDNHVDIANEMVMKSNVDVIMGACHPMFNGNGESVDKPSSDWTAEFFRTPASKWSQTRLIETKADFEALAQGKLDMLGCNRLVGTAQASEGIQVDRSATKDWNHDGKIDRSDIPAAPPFGDPFLKTTPTLDTMSLGALNLLSKNQNGFFLMIEGGAVDHANHFNWPGRMVEESVQFFRCIETVSRWIEKHGGWEQNLLMVTTDHECGNVQGPNSPAILFDPIVDHGKGKLPGFRQNSKNHTNALIPVFARGAGAALLKERVVGKDPFRGSYTNNTELFQLIVRALPGSR